MINRDVPSPALRAQMEANCFAAVAVTRAARLTMRAQCSGAIVNISSLGGQLSVAGFGAYSASKFALERMSGALAQELAPFGIKVLIVEPGAFRTEFASDSLKQMPIIYPYRSVVDGTRDYACSIHAVHDGDPMKATAAIVKTLEASTTPLRLQLGRDAVQRFESTPTDCLPI